MDHVEQAIADAGGLEKACPDMYWLMRAVDLGIEVHRFEPHHLMAITKTCHDLEYLLVAGAEVSSFTEESLRTICLDCRSVEQFADLVELGVGSRLFDIRKLEELAGNDIQDLVTLCFYTSATWA